jgi:ribulose-5-phosphate 4-epimerase/fuculose-1-phosphate aldolase
VAAGDLSAFVRAGATLARLGLVHASEGNLSTFDGRTLAITRTGCRLGALSPADVLTGTLDEPPPAASSDLAIHVAEYRARGAGALAHAHPSGTVPEGWFPGQPHGAYAFAASLEDAVASLARDAGVG